MTLLENHNRLQCSRLQENSAEKVTFYGLTDEDILQVVQAIRENTVVAEIYLGKPKLTELGVDYLLYLLRNSPPTLKGLTVSDNKHKGILPVAIYANLHLTQLRYLQLWTDPLDRAALTALAHVLETNTNLKELRLCYSRVTDAALSEIAQALKYNTTLETLDLGNNLIVNTEPLVDLLRTNTTLLHLHLDNNRIDDTGAAALASVLETNTTLQTLNLNVKTLSAVAAQAIGASLPRMTGLKTLHVGSMRGVDFMKPILVGLRNNASLCALAGKSIFTPQIRFYVGSFHRRAFLHPYDLTLWPYILQMVMRSSQGNLDVLYYYLREKPDLMQRPPTLR